MNKKICIFFFIGALVSLNSLSQENKVELKTVAQEFQRSNYHQVIQLAEKALKEGAQQPEFYFYLGISYMKVSKKSEAKNSLKIFLKDAEYNEKNFWMLRQAIQNLVSIHREDKNYTSMLEDAYSVLEKGKSIPQKEELENICKYIIIEALKEIGNQKASANDLAGAIEAYQKLLEYKLDTSIAIKIADYYKNLGRKDLAAEYYLKSAMGWSAWMSKLMPLSYVVELLWETDNLEEFLKKATADSVSYNFLSAAILIKKGKSSDAFSDLKKLEDDIGSKGFIAEKLLRTISLKYRDDPLVFFYFITNFPENPSTPWAMNSIVFIARSHPESEGIIKEKILPELTRLVENSTQPEVRKIFPALVDLKFPGIPEVETVKEKLRMLEDFRQKHPDDPIIVDILRRQATLYTENLQDYRKGKEIYTELLNKFNKKDVSLQLAKCLINLGENDDALNLIKKFIADDRKDEFTKFQAGQLLLQANFFDEGIKILNEIDVSTKNKWLKQQIRDVMKDFRQYLEEDIKAETMGHFVVFRLNHTDYYFTSYISIDKDAHLLFQTTETLEIVPFSSKRENISCLIECSCHDEISLTKPYAMVLKKNDMYTTSLRKVVSFSADKWRKAEGVSIFFPWQDVCTENITVIRNYEVQGEFSFSNIIFDRLRPGAKIEITFSPRAGKIESVLPESTDYGSSGTITFNPSGEKFEVKIKFKPSGELVSYYPKVKVTYEEKEIIKPGASGSKFTFDAGKTSIGVVFDSEISVHSIIKSKETIYEIDEKIDI